MLNVRDREWNRINQSLVSGLSCFQDPIQLWGQRLPHSIRGVCSQLDSEGSPAEPLLPGVVDTIMRGQKFLGMLNSEEKILLLILLTDLFFL